MNSRLNRSSRPLRSVSSAFSGRRKHRDRASADDGVETPQSRKSDGMSSGENTKEPSKESGAYYIRTSANRSNRGANGADRSDVDLQREPVEYYMSALQSMRIGELKKVMNKAGVFFDPSDVVEKGDMISIFVNSGEVVLLPEKTAKECKRDVKRKSKIEKIYELQAENNTIKAQNEALKKKVKEVEYHLKDAEREEIPKVISLNPQSSKEVESKPTISQTTPAHSTVDKVRSSGVDKYAGDAANVFDAFENNVSAAPTSQSQKSKEQNENDVSVVKEPIVTSRKARGESQSVRTERKRERRALQREIASLKRERTTQRFEALRMQKEIDSLEVEVSGLQVELNKSLEVIEDMESDISDTKTRDVMLNKELNDALKAVAELRGEASKRDKLIKSLTNELLQKDKKLSVYALDRSRQEHKEKSEKGGEGTAENASCSNETEIVLDESGKKNQEMVRMQTDLVQLVEENNKLRREMTKMFERMDEIEDDRGHQRQTISKLKRKLSRARSRKKVVEVEFEEEKIEEEDEVAW